MNVVIAAAGLVSAGGLSLAENAATTRARLACFREIAWLDRRFEPFIVAGVPDDGLPPLSEALAAAHLQSREARTLRLAHAALADLFAGLPPDLPAVPLLLGLSEHHTTQVVDPARFLRNLALQAGACFEHAGSIAAPRGRAAGLMALGRAASCIAAGQAEFMLVGGVDSLIDLYVLGTLDRAERIRGETVSDGFTPGEGAAFLLLASEAAAGKHGIRPLARVAACGSGVEAGHLYSDEPYLGDGLAAAVRAALEAAGLGAPIQTTCCSFNGERYWAREFGVTRIRNAEHFAPDNRMEHPAECFGDLGAAHGAALAALAAHGIADGYMGGPVLAYASSDKGDRAALVLDRTA
jgi:3-oxoacyl-[acyl-carrier-protein] synthase-1